MATRLLAYLDAHYLRDRTVTPGTAYLYRHSVMIFCRWLGRSARLADLADDRLNDFLAWAESENYAAWTRWQWRRSLLAIRRHAAERGLISPPCRVRRVPLRMRPPRAWTTQDLAKLIAATASLGGTLPNGVSQRDYFRALLLAAWDLGCRRGDLWNLRREDIDSAGTIAIMQAKTGRQVARRLRPETLRAISALPGDRPLAWPFVVSYFYTAVGRLCRLAGVERGGLQRIRRSAASYVERDQPGTAWRFLGHASPGLDQRHYIDPTIAYPAPVLPPPIE